MPLDRHLEAWRRIGAPPFVLRWIQEGVPLCFQERPPHKSFQKNRVHDPKEKQFVSCELQHLAQRGILTPVDFKPHCVLPLQVAPKASGGFCLITDCRHVNSYLKVPKFSQGGIKEVVENIQTGDKLITVDLKDGFFHIPVHRCDQKFLGIAWKGQFFVWSRLPFGLSCSPYYFNKTLRPVVNFIREQGLRVVLWVDDFLQMMRPNLATDHKDFLLQTLAELGWSVNFKKSQLCPKTFAVYVGFLVSSDHEG